MTKYVEAIGLIGALVVYLVPSLEADAREHPYALAITLVNVFLGWTVIGWFAALHAARTPEGGQRLTQIARTARLAIARGTIDKLVAHAHHRTAFRPRFAQAHVADVRVTKTRSTNQRDWMRK
ncbi:superinfection immunity protein [Paraburkholderia rhizosphaerae]|uniref:T4 superinfection immunity protein n=1 Tax=Paraburkholderia rhizosphaerae TaxID=480658 RepID=A0A4R8LIN5_9BURK|nr:superinfection immunity protein [Paraburkholderia rhizosphaerae]TDY42288.1 T4 superinfection immunity protein [Paraburkholderia rhizosphaerae]